jgi:hypothetical protein
MYELKTEREQLMQKVDAQSNYIEKAAATAKAQAKQLLDQNKRIKQLEEEIQHVKTSKMIDKIAHKNIHGPREKGHMSEEETHSKKVAGDNLSETTQRSEQIKKTTISVKSFDLTIVLLQLLQLHLPFQCNVIAHLPFASIVPVPFSIHTFSHLIY